LFPRFAACDRKYTYRFSSHYNFFLTGCGSHARSRRSASARADQSSLTTASQAANECACRGSAADLGDVALGMALAFGADGGAGDMIAVNRREANGYHTWLVQAAARLGIGHLALGR